jgi:hypothetical protein
MTIPGKGGKPIGQPKSGGRAKGTPNRATAAFKEKLAALGCDPLAELVKMAQHDNAPSVFSAHIYFGFLPYMFPKRKAVEDDGQERPSGDGQAVTPEEALAWARDLIEMFSRRGTPLLEASASLIESEAEASAEDQGEAEASAEDQGEAEASAEDQGEAEASAEEQDGARRSKTRDD